MPLFFLSPLRFLAKALTAEESPKQLAAGFGLGLVLGLVPKSNLAAQVLALLFFSTRANVGAMLLSAFLFSWLALATDHLAHPIGLALLNADALAPLWTFLYDLPVVPWTRFNNSVVLGSLVLGAALAYPAYRLSEPRFAKYQPKIAEKLKKYRAVQLLLGAEMTERFR